MLLGLVACSRQPPKPAADDAAESTATVPRAETPDAAPAGPATETAEADSGIAYLGILGRCASVLGSTGVETVGALPLECRSILAAGPEGELYASTQDALLVLREGKVESIPGGGSIDGLAVARDGSLWTIGSHGVGRYAEGRWSFEPESSLGPDVRVLEAVAVDGRDRVHVAALDAVFRKTETGWLRLAVRLQPDETSPGIEPVLLFKALRAGGDGRLYVVEDARIFRVDGDVLTQLPLPLERAVNDLAVDGRGVLTVRHNRNDVVVVTAGGEVLRKLSASTGDFAGRAIGALDVDERDRLWLATEAGLYVFLPDGDKRFWPTASFEGLAGPVEAMIVVGAGPDGLPAEAVAATATVAGVVEIAGGGSAGVRVQLCPAPSMSSRYDTPCSDAAIHVEATTDEGGKFRMEGVPVTTFGLAVHAGNRWIVTSAEGYGSAMRRGEVFDVGVVAIPATELGAEAHRR